MKHSAHQEDLAERLGRIFDATIKAGKYKSRAAVLKAAGLSSGYLTELRKRIRTQGSASLTMETAAAIAHAVGCDPSQLMGAAPHTGLTEPYPERVAAVVAARALQLPELAIAAVLTEEPSDDPGRLYWFRRIETEAERLRPSARAIS